MLFGTYSLNPIHKEPILVIFHHSELNYYTNKPSLYAPAGGLTIRRIKKLIEECKREGKEYDISAGARFPLFRRGIH